MTVYKNFKKLLLNRILFVTIIIFTFHISVNLTFAAQTPSLSLTNNGSTVSINVTGADGFASVLFNYPNDSTYSSFTSIDIGQTNSSGSFNLSVAPNSYGLNVGYPVYVSIDGAISSKVNWPSSSNTQTVQNSGTLSLSRQSATLVVGQTVNIAAIKSSNTLTISGNTNPTIATASVTQDNWVFVNAMNTGSTILTICAGADGCNNVTVTVQSPSQTVSFSQSVANIVKGQSAQSISIYGPGTYYGLSNSNQNVLSASISGNNLLLSGYDIGSSVVTLCATGYQCGSLTVNVLSSGTVAPTATILPATDYTNKPPQISSFSINSNNVNGAFFGEGTTLSMNFKSNESVTNVQVKVNGIQTAVGDAGNSTYGASYTFKGNETLPLPVYISFANSNGQIGQFYYWIGNSPMAVTSNTSSQQSTNNSSSNIFTKNLHIGMTELNVSDSEVLALQKYLKEKGVYSGPITGYFGPLTKTAVQAYQKKHSLEQIGSVGPGTRALLNSGK